MNPSEQIVENYFLGDSDEELVRLRGQDNDLSDATTDVISRLDIKPGSRILELGCGPGFVAVNNFSKLIKVKKQNNVGYMYYSNLSFASLPPSPTLLYTTLCHRTYPSNTLPYFHMSYTTLHYLTMHHTILHFTTLPLHFTSLHFTSLHFTSLHFTSLHFTSLYCSN